MGIIYSPYGVLPYYSPEGARSACRQGLGWLSRGKGKRELLDAVSGVWTCIGLFSL